MAPPPPTYEERRSTAYHEAAHAIACLRESVKFQSLHLMDADGFVKLPTRGAKIKFQNRRSYLGLLRYGRGNRRGVDEAKGMFTNSERFPRFIAVTYLSGICAEKIDRPDKDYNDLINTGGSGDWKDARIAIRSHFIFMPSTENAKPIHFTNEDADSVLIEWLGHVQQFVFREWAAISRIGDALLASPTNMLTYAECKALS